MKFQTHFSECTCYLLLHFNLKLLWSVSALFYWVLIFIINISRFYNGLNHPPGSNSFYFNRNVIEGSHEMYNCYVFLTFRSFFSKYTFLRLRHFISLSTYPINSILSVLFSISHKIYVLMNHIFVLATDALVIEKLPFSYFRGNHS